VWSPGLALDERDVPDRILQAGHDAIRVRQPRSECPVSQVHGQAGAELQRLERFLGHGAAARAAHAALGHPLLRRAAEASKRGELRRETPVLLRIEAGRIAEGIVDLALREKIRRRRGWTVVDFKTDRELASRRREYEYPGRPLRALAVARRLPQVVVIARSLAFFVRQAPSGLCTARPIRSIRGGPFDDG